MERPDERIAWLARRQHGLFSGAQAEAAGFTSMQQRRRVERGQWVRVTRGVLGLNGIPPSLRRSAMAAQLARPDSVASHLTAAALHGWDEQVPPRPTITVPPGTSGRSPIAAVHRRRVPEHLVTTVEGIRCTRPERTIVDCATDLGPIRHGRLVDDALHRRITTAQAVLDVVDVASHLAPHRKAELIDRLEVWLPTIRPGSVAEARFLRQIDEWGLPRPSRQVEIRDRAGQVIARVDGGWPDRRVAYEYDSVEWHGPAAWASDEARHSLVTSLGWKLVHVDKADLSPGARRTRDLLVAALCGPLPVPTQV